MPPFTYKETTRIALEQKLLQPITQMQNINLAIPDKHTQGSLNQSEMRMLHNLSLLRTCAI